MHYLNVKILLHSGNNVSNLFSYDYYETIKVNNKTFKSSNVCTIIQKMNNYFNYKINEINNGNITIDICENEIWFVNHIVSYENPRHYYHSIAVFDENMNLLRYSAPFKFEENPIEYCLSIVVEDEQVVINYSTWDRTTRIGIYDKKYIETTLIYS
jgi:hypothetical protein